MVDLETEAPDVEDGPPISDDELAALALAADVEAPLPDDAVALDLPGRGPGLLPGWYMPASSAPAEAHRPWRRLVVLLVVLAFLAINAAGLCSTYGTVGFG